VEFKSLAGELGELLRSIVETIDKYGLKRRHLHKHKAEVARFFRALEARVYRSELALGYRKRLLKSEGKLFTFLDHDGVPWNNNNAEHAVRAFAYYRRISDGQVREKPLADYLVLLSVYQTCKYRGVSFLKFLLSGEADVDAFCQGRRRKKGSAPLEIYPEGFPRTYRSRPRDGEGEGSDGGGRAGRVRWKAAILASLRDRPETGAGRHDIAEYCAGLIRDGTLATAVPADDRWRVDRIVRRYLYAMKQAGEVVPALGKAYFATGRGLAWLETHSSPANDMRPPDEPARLV
jgi:hypothetical protein